MSAEVNRIFRRPKSDTEKTDFPTIAFRSALPHPRIDTVDEIVKHDVGHARHDA